MTLNTLPIPTVRSAAEAAEIAHDFDHVISLVEDRSMVTFTHQSHLILEMEDTDLPETGGPSALQVRRILEFAQAIGPSSLLVHCQLGRSRSTAAAAAVLCVWGAAPKDAALALWEQHPDGRGFWPNPRLAALADEQLELDGVLSSALAALSNEPRPSIASDPAS